MSLKWIPRNEMTLGALVLVFLNTLHIVYLEAEPENIPTSSAWFYFLSHFCQHSLFLVFLMYSILTGVKWYLIDLIWISLIIRDDEQILSSVLQAICLFTSKNFLFFSSPHFYGIIKFAVIVLCECLFIFEY